jgi:flagellar basal body L-ring protein FlgH
MRLSTLTRTAAIKAATLVAVAALLLVGCGSNNSDDSNTNGSKPAAASTKSEPKLPKTKITIVSDWTTEPDNPYVEYRVIKIGDTCLVETDPTTVGDNHSPTALNDCIGLNK